MKKRTRCDAEEEQQDDNSDNNTSSVILYCKCRQPYDESRDMICCDFCDEWYHLQCVKIDPSSVQYIQFYVCPRCRRYGSTQYWYDEESKTGTVADKQRASHIRNNQSGEMSHDATTSNKSNISSSDDSDSVDDDNDHSSDENDDNSDTATRNECCLSSSDSEQESECNNRTDDDGDKEESDSENEELLDDSDGDYDDTNTTESQQDEECSTNSQSSSQQLNTSTQEKYQMLHSDSKYELNDQLYSIQSVFMSTTIGAAKFIGISSGDFDDSQDCEIQQMNTYRKSCLFYLNSLARSENTEFCELNHCVMEDVYHAKLLVKAIGSSINQTDDSGTRQKEKPIGYFTYTLLNGCHPCLRQIFIIKSERRKGHASMLVSHFLKDMCEDSQSFFDRFYIEKPNQYMCEVIYNLGFCYRWQAKLSNTEHAGSKEEQATSLLKSKISEMNLTEKDVSIFFISKTEKKRFLSIINKRSLGSDNNRTSITNDEAREKSRHIVIYYPIGNLLFDMPKQALQTKMKRHQQKRRKLE